MPDDHPIHSKPSRVYLPWLGWACRLTAIPALLLLLGYATSIPEWFRALIALLAFVALLKTVSPIKQRFSLQSQGSTALISLRATFTGNVWMHVREGGDASRRVKLGKIGWTTRYMEFPLDFRGSTKTFTLIHLANTGYFLLSENVGGPGPLASITENCFEF